MDDDKLEPGTAPAPAAPTGCALSLARWLLGAAVYFAGLAAAYWIAVSRHPGMSEDAQGAAAMVLVLMFPVHLFALAFVGIASFSTRPWRPVLVASGAALIASLLWYAQSF